MATVIKDAVTSIAQGASQAFFPLCCAFCDRGIAEPFAGVSLCRECHDRLVSDQLSLCRLCGVQVNPLVQHVDGCPYCRHAKFRFSDAVTLGPYRDSLRTAIVRMKRSSEQCLTHAMATLLAARVREQHIDCDAVVAVPMHWTRRMIRGSNTAERLGESVAAALAADWLPSLVRLGRRTRKQSLLDPADRRRNLAGAFKVSGWADLKGKHVGIVDDTMTTGTTMNELARCLRRAGSRRVTAIVVARATRK